MAAIEWVVDNKEWLFSGVGVAVIAGLWRAGRRAKRSDARINPSGLPEPASQSTATPNVAPLSNLGESTAKGRTHLSSDAPLEVDDLLDQIVQMPLVQRDAAWFHYLGLRVAVTGGLWAVHSVPNNKFRVQISTRRHDTDVWFEVPREQYPRLAVANSHSTLAVVGVLARARPELELSDASILEIA